MKIGLTRAAISGNGKPHLRAECMNVHLFNYHFHQHLCMFQYAVPCCGGTSSVLPSTLQHMHETLANQKTTPHIRYAAMSSYL